MAKKSAEEIGRDLIGIKSIDLVVNNHRTNMDQDKLVEMASSMDKVGLMNPIGLCKRGKRYVMIYGHRRLEAAKLLKWTKIKADVYKGLTDLQIAEMQFVENLQREDLTPIDEALGIKALMDAGQSIDIIASRIERSIVFVRSRLDLLRLHKNIQPLVASGRIPLAHARLIARIGDQSIQQDVVSDISQIYDLQNLQDITQNDYVAPLDQVRNIITNRLQTLGGRGWPMDCEYAGQRPCQGCPDNTTTEPGLFDGINLPGKSPKGNCTNVGCFTVKAKAWDNDPDRQARVQARERVQRDAEKKDTESGQTSPTQGRRKRSPEEIELYKKRQAFPATLEEIYAVQLWQYGSDLADLIAKTIKAEDQLLPADAGACLINLAISLNPWTLQIEEGRLSGPQLIKHLERDEPMGFSRDFLIQVFSVVAEIIEGSQPEWPAYSSSPQNVPLDEDYMQAIDCVEALAKRWKINLLTLPQRPTPPAAVQPVKESKKKQTRGKKKNSAAVSA